MMHSAVHTLLIYVYYLNRCTKKQILTYKTDTTHRHTLTDKQTDKRKTDTVANKRDRQIKRQRNQPFLPGCVYLSIFNYFDLVYQCNLNRSKFYYKVQYYVMKVVKTVVISRPFPHHNHSCMQVFYVSVF